MGLRRIKLQKIPTVDIDLEAPAAERWHEAADCIAEDAYGAFERIDAFADERIETYVPTKLRWLVEPLLGGAAYSVRMATRYFGLEYAEELRGFARALDLPYSRVLAANLIYDLVVATEESAPGACSSFSCPSPDGSILLGRNLDWNFPEGIGDHTVLMRFHRRKEHYLAIGVAGYLGVLTAMRPGHWAISLNQAPRARRRFNWQGVPVGQQLRWACDHSRAYQTLVRNVTRYQTLQPYFAHIVGTQLRQQVVVESFGDNYNLRKPEDDVLVQTNHYVTPDFQNLNRNEWTDTEGVEWVTDSEPRYNALEKRLTKKRPANAAECLKFLQNPVANEDTCQSMGLHPFDRDLVMRCSR